MNEEIQAIKKSKTQELVSYSRKKEMYVKWIYKLKLKPNREISKYKARLVEKFLHQKPGIDFHEVYAPISKLETLGLVVAISTYRG